MPSFPKPEPRSRVKARAARAEAELVKVVREECVARDGYCRARGVLMACRGPSEWAHLGDKRRSHTRGMPLEERHDSAWTCMLCDGHHDAYDGSIYDIVAVDSAAGANGSLAYRDRASGCVWMELGHVGGLKRCIDAREAEAIAALVEMSR